MALQGLPSLALEATKAAQHIYAVGVLDTPLMACPRLSQGAQVHLKLENRQASALCQMQGGWLTKWSRQNAAQVTGSFKARGATHKVA